MSRSRRDLSPQEAEVWDKVARTVTPLEPRRAVAREKDIKAPKAIGAMPVQGKMAAVNPSTPARKVKGRVPPALPPRNPPPKPPKADAPLHLDGSWERRIGKGTLVPDFSLDLHGSNLDQAYMRLMHGLMQARTMGARVVLVVAGKARPVDAMDRGSSRGAIRAKLADWIAASEHASHVVAIRNAHRRHGGSGALYVVLKRSRR